jgi:hypothetical protein
LASSPIPLPILELALSLRSRFAPQLFLLLLFPTFQPINLQTFKQRLV